MGTRLVNSCTINPTIAVYCLFNVLFTGKPGEREALYGNLGWHFLTYFLFFSYVLLFVPDTNHWAVLDSFGDGG